MRSSSLAHRGAAMTVVVLAEKRSVADDIAKVLKVTKAEEHAWVSDEIVVTWAVGHLVGLKYPEDYDPEFKNWHKTIDRLPIVPDVFEYKALGGRTRKQLTAITKLMKGKSVTELVNACDAAREGELIFRSIVEHAGITTPTTRMWLQSMTSEAIQTAWEQRTPSTQYDALGDAARSRSEADWIIGMNGSRIGNTFLKGRRERTTISLGRVQTATLAMIVDEELDILSHVPQPYWQVESTVTSGDASWTARWQRRNHVVDEDRPEYKPHRILEQSERDMVATEVENGAKVTVHIHERTKHEQPPLNFDLTTLQRTANSMWSWSSKRTLSIAQDLYDRYKVTTYPRTDSKHLPSDMGESIDAVLTSLNGTEYGPLVGVLRAEGLRNESRNMDDAKVSDHHAIIPTGTLPESMPPEHVRLYDLIVRRFLASWADQSTWRVETRTASTASHDLVRTVEHLEDDGWRKMIPKSAAIPEAWGVVSDGAAGALSDVTFEEEASKPKNRLREAGVLRLMENAGKYVDDDEFSEALKDRGIGTPATRADTIEKLLERQYIRRSRNGHISATAIGIRIIDVLRRIGVDWITSAELTGEMEHVLLEVQRGRTARSTYMSDIVERTTDMVHRIKNHDRSVLYANEEALGPCPTCKGDVIETTLSYQCVNNAGASEGCPFIFWKDTSGRYFDRATAARLMAEGSLESLHGFFSRTDEEYDATVSIDAQGSVRTKGNGAGAVEASDEPVGACPVCADGTVRSGADGYACDAEACTFRGINGVMCQHPVTVEEARAIITDGRSPLIEDFISRRGKPFKAYLVLEGKKVAYEFPPREADANATKFEVKEGTVGVCPRHGCDIIETPTHFAPASSGTGCKISIARELCKRELTREEAHVLIEKGEVGPFSDLISKKGNPFTAVVWLNKAEQARYRFAKRE